MDETLRSILLIGAVLLTVGSCGNLVAHSDRGSVDEWLKSEHSLIKKRVTSLERENSVLAKENEDQAERIEKLQSSIKVLQSEIGDWKVKYLRDTETLSAELNKLLDEKTSLENERAEKILELEAIRESDRQRYEAEIEALNDQLAQQRDAFSQERENIRNECVKKQVALDQRIEGLGRDLASRDGVIESFRASNEDLSRKFESCLREVGEKTLSLQLLQEEIQKLRGGPETPRGSAEGIPSRTEANAP